MNTDELFKALDKFEEQHKVPVVESTLPGFMDKRNELILAIYKFAITELDYKRK
jgi:hypothetical protein